MPIIRHTDCDSRFQEYVCRVQVATINITIASVLCETATLGLPSPRAVVTGGWGGHGVGGGGDAPILLHLLSLFAVVQHQLHSAVAENRQATAKVQRLFDETELTWNQFRVSGTRAGTDRVTSAH